MTADDIARIRDLAHKADPALGPMAPVLLSKQNVLALCKEAEEGIRLRELLAREAQK